MCRGHLHCLKKECDDIDALRQKFPISTCTLESWLKWKIVFFLNRTPIGAEISYGCHFVRFFHLLVYSYAVFAQLTFAQRSVIKMNLWIFYCKLFWKKYLLNDHRVTRYFFLNMWVIVKTVWHLYKYIRDTY